MSAGEVEDDEVPDLVDTGRNADADTEITAGASSALSEENRVDSLYGNAQTHKVPITIVTGTVTPVLLRKQHLEAQGGC